MLKWEHVMGAWLCQFVVESSIQLVAKKIFCTLFTQPLANDQLNS